MSERDAGTTEHDDSPELTDSDFARAISFRDVLERGAALPAATTADGPATIAFAMDGDLVQDIRASGPGHRERVEAILRQALTDGRI